MSYLPADFNYALLPKDFADHLLYDRWIDCIARLIYSSPVPLIVNATLKAVCAASGYFCDCHQRRHH
jgi:hypothetical protein